MRASFRIKKLAEVEALLPGFKSMWPALKAACGTTQRAPKSVTFTDEPSRACPSDYDSCKRFALDLRDMTLSNSLHISAGEWACHAGSNNDESVTSVPTTHALLTCTYNDYYRSFSLDVQVAELPKQLASAS